MCAMKSQIMIGHVTVQCAFVVVLMVYVVDLIIPTKILL